ncbi:hypothetical protein DH2020_014662 [Rehmannia glutinosa]|uniref:RRM domain-containing protein n=1 Tax=Rehmannia glutinosa TaxID=99300 RepID=A0ABR0WX27_REHGL
MLSSLSAQIKCKSSRGSGAAPWWSGHTAAMNNLARSLAQSSSPPSSEDRAYLKMGICLLEFDSKALAAVYRYDLALEAIVRALVAMIVTERWNKGDGIRGSNPIVESSLLSYSTDMVILWFVDYFDRRSAALAIVAEWKALVWTAYKKLTGHILALRGGHIRPGFAAHFNVFVGDLSRRLLMLPCFACFSVYPTCSDARVMWDQKTGRSRGFGFCFFCSQQDAQSAINDLNGSGLEADKFAAIGLKRCWWSGDDQQNSDKKHYDGQEKSDAPENNQQYTTVYVGNLAPEVTSVELHHHFHARRVGTIEDIRIQRDKGFGFIRYPVAMLKQPAIQMGNARLFLANQLRPGKGILLSCSWGSKPTPPGTGSAPLPPPAAAHMPAFVGDLAAYEKKLALSKIGAQARCIHKLIGLVLQVRPYTTVDIRALPQPSHLCTTSNIENSYCCFARLGFGF